MSLNAIMILIRIILCILALLYGFVIYTKLKQARKRRLSKIYSHAIKDRLNGLLYSDDLFFEAEATLFITQNRNMVKNGIYREAIENILVDCIETNQKATADRAIFIAYGFDFPSKCISQIRNYRSVVIAEGCQRAGLYRYADAIPDMLDALSVFSSDTQMEILLALSTIGDISAIMQAFDKIHNMMFINERGISEIMFSFVGDKKSLYRHMITHSSDYVSALFLKAIDRDNAFALEDEIVKIVYEKDKEKRIAALKALGKTKDPALGRHFIGALSDPDWEVRSVSAKILGDIIVPEAGEPLATAICDREWWVRQNAATSLLRYPECEDLFTEILKLGDKYAHDSILHALDDSDDNELAEKIRGIPVMSESDLLKEREYCMATV